LTQGPYIANGLACKFFVLLRDMVAVLSGSRGRNGTIALVWLLAGMVVLMRSALQYTSFGGSAPRNPYNSRMTRGSDTSANAMFGNSGGSQQELGNPFEYSDGSSGVQIKGAMMGVAAISAVVTLFQGLVQIPVLAVIILTALIAGVVAREGSLKGGGLNMSFGYGKSKGMSSWSTPGVNQSWQSSFNSAPASTPSATNQGQRSSWSAPSSNAFSWTPGGSSSQNSWQKKWFGR